jgi:hypothetical protein
VTHRVIHNRVRRLARNALAVMDHAMSRPRLREDLAMDGFASFTRSHYHPGTITHLTGAASQFIYAAVHTSERRSGAMRADQRRRRALIDSRWRPPSSLAEDCSLLLADVAPAISARCTSAGTLRLDTDQHPAYRPALLRLPLLRRQLARGRLVHRQTSSRAKRTTSNPLFPVNYVDRQLRKNLAEHVRHTVRPAREINAQMERLALFITLHNFLTPHRVSGHARVHHRPTHAQQAGIGDARCAWLLQRLTSHRHLFSHTTSNQQWIRRIWLRRYANPPAVRVRDGALETRTLALDPSRLPAYLLA